MSSQRLKPRKNAKQDRSKQTINFIMEATSRILKSGEALTTNHIAKLAGISIGSLYQYFPNKKSILKKYIDKEVQETLTKFFEETSIIEAKAQSSAQLIDGLVDYFIESYSDKQTIFRFLITHAQELEITPAIIEAQQREIDFLAEMMARHGHDLRIQDFKIASSLVVMSSLGIIRSLWENPDRMNRIHISNELKVMMKRYLLKSDSINV